MAGGWGEHLMTTWVYVLFAANKSDEDDESTVLVGDLLGVYTSPKTAEHFNAGIALVHRRNPNGIEYWVTQDSRHLLLAYPLMHRTFDSIGECI